MNYLLLDIDRFPNEAVTKTETTDVLLSIVLLFSDVGWIFFFASHTHTVLVMRGNTNPSVPMANR
jgi:hypothetical protein